MEQDTKFALAKLFAEKYKEPLIKAVKDSCQQTMQMSRDDIETILCLSLFYTFRLSEHKEFTHEWVEDVAENAVILCFLCKYKYKYNPSLNDKTYISMIQRAREGFYGEIPGTKMKIEVTVKEKEVLRHSIKIPSRKTTKVVEREKYVLVCQKTYLMRDDNTGYTKIGKSINPRHRERTLRADKPTITLFRVCEVNVERELHAKFADKRIRGEWFELTQDDIEWICKEYNFKEVE